ncbi:MAG: shikimate dehydrogenase [Bacteroidota bacterium]|nr:shikimate dehydrogenase [Bacteroidota bacterium]
MIYYGLIGYPLTHSASARLFADKFRREKITDRQYLLFPLEDLSMLSRLIQEHPLLRGLNVTIPYKEKILPFLDEIDPAAAEIGAINTIVIKKSDTGSKLKGYNTDVTGFLNSADFSGHSRALILGTGGASKAVAAALKSKGIEITFVSRNSAGKDVVKYSSLTQEMIHENTLIVNATPLGMFPMIHSFPPIPYKALTRFHFLYDLVYNPNITEFIKMGMAEGCHVQNGWNMLLMQAEKSYEIWNA